MVFLPGNNVVPITDESSVLEVALKNRVDLSHSCGGMGSCTTCRVLVESDPSQLSPRTELEDEITKNRGFSNRERLACQLEPAAGLVVRIPAARADKNRPPND